MFIASLVRAILLAGLAVFPSTAATQTKPKAQHRHHDDMPLDAEHFGQVSFPISCAPADLAPFERGIALLHSFGYTEAEAQFRALAVADPACAMAHWGIAFAQFHQLWGRPDPKEIAVGASEIKLARELAAKAPQTTPRELAYLQALAGFYTTAATGFQPAADGYAAAMSVLHSTYPQDLEAAAFYALALLASTPPNDTSLEHERKALAILVPLFQQHPEHPGLAHYIIHTCDTPALASQGLDAARVYAGLAPSSPHALHMPGHIFARLGMWPEDIASNLASVAASDKAEAAHEPGAAHQMHAEEFLIYAYLQVGQDEKAADLAARLHSIGERMAAMPGMDDMKGAGHFLDNEMRAMTAMEMRDWPRALSLTADPGSKDSDAYNIDWAHGVAAGHLRNASAAGAALRSMDRYIHSLRNTPYAFQAEGMQVKRNEMLAWKAFAGNHPEAALEAMRSAADQQDKLGQDEVDIPAREMLGDLLLAMRRPAEALAAYRVALRLSPNRLNGLLGAGQAAEFSGNPSAAVVFYTQAARSTGNGAFSQRAQLRHAVLFGTSHTEPRGR